MRKLLVVLFFFLALYAYGQQKHALVIGNGNYNGIPRLTNPVNDANDMEAALKNLGFTVEKVLNGNLEQMESALIRLKNRLSVSKNSYGFLFYAGHGVQSGGVNYLIPVGSSIPSENFLRERALSVQAMLGELNDAGNELNIVVLDACRDNPFGWARSSSRGLTVVGNQPADSIIVFATSAGSTASDGSGRNGLFTGQLLKNLKVPGLEVSEVFLQTGADVAQASNRQQMPAVYNQFFGRAYLGTEPVAAHPQPAAAPAGFKVNLADNFQYGNTYQGGISQSRCGTGALAVGDSYTVKISYSPSRDLEDTVMFGFVNLDPPSYWTQLTWDDAQGIELHKAPIAKAGEVVSAEFKLDVIRPASKYVLIVMTLGEGTPYRQGSGTMKAVTLDISEFSVTKN